jgi:hypothetical protein
MSTLVVATQSRAAQTGQILIPDFVTAVVQLVTGIGLLGVAAMVRAARVVSRFFLFYYPRFSLHVVTNKPTFQVISVLVESVLPVIQQRFWCVDSVTTPLGLHLTASHVLYFIVLV